MKFIFKLCSFTAVCLFVMAVVAVQAPVNFPKDQFDIEVPKSSSLSFVSNYLYQKQVISSPFLFKVFTVISGGKKGITAGDYRFTEPQNVISIANRIVKGDQRLPIIKITIPEGTNISDMAYIYMTKLTKFNAPKFVLLAKDDEGYLFPDTYNFLSNTKPEEVIEKMKANFYKKIKDLQPDIEKSGRTIKDIITMASIVEEEAKGLVDKGMVSGILWNRLDGGMPLQVDAPFYFITGKLGHFTYNDLKIDSSYNTYVNKGLPAGPISNPGLESIKATVNPTPTKYLFYLTGRDGVMRYAATYDIHLKNKNTYLN